MKPGKQIKIKQKQTKPEYFIFLFVHQINNNKKIKSINPSDLPGSTIHYTESLIFFQE